MLSNRFRRLAGVALVALAVTGCAHRNLIKDGEEYYAQGRYELAVEMYEEALKLKPNDKETQNRLQQARRDFTAWLNEVRRSANTAYDRNNLGKAMVLYGKVAQATHEQSAWDRYNSAYQTLATQHQFRIQLDSDRHIFGDDLGYGVAGLQIVKKANGKRDNEARVGMSRAPVRFNLSESVVHEVQQYVSGQVMVSNPDFIRLQGDVSDQRYQLDRAKDNLRDARRDFKRERRELESLERDLAREEKTLGKLSPADSQYDSQKREVERLKDKVSRQRDDVRRADDEVDKKGRRLDRADHKLDSLLTDFSIVPPTVLEDVYSDYHYERYILTKTASSALVMEVDGRRSDTPVSVVSEDDYYDDHYTIGLTRKSAMVESDLDMESRLNSEVRIAAQNRLKAMVSDYKQSLLLKATQVVGNDDRFDAWVAHGVAGSPGVDGFLADKMRQYLERELGRGGELDINALLALHPGA
ncbi:protein containing tetratricopeptide repeat (TPR1, TPR2) [Hahella chejuensis KCTC 2396]|uniref:Protein containing tetratricopeptide repeat (TPR1, TPR2) n=1 Tax=Hahella chejuensis (strain KCTC 2396) TaxID=349521 RepID=Q2SKV7_HAHCH|nr:tetratricopeptide repeat protein [Hahella chejuensis]ABC28717.1 protein containing tetratricopeptide repeat (TPR1, TPR2) [Hahella chejuensis KCTC 2396]